MFSLLKKCQSLVINGQIPRFLSSIVINTKTSSPTVKIMNSMQINYVQQITLPPQRRFPCFDYFLPSISQPMLICGLPSIVEKHDPLPISIEIKDPTELQIVEKHAERMLIRRRKKMKKHKLKKRRRKMKYLILNIRLKREVKKESEFKAELLSYLKAAEDFDAEKYVNGVLKKIRERPKPPSAEEEYEKARELYKKLRSSVEVISPKL